MLVNGTHRSKIIQHRRNRHRKHSTNMSKSTRIIHVSIRPPRRTSPTNTTTTRSQKNTQPMGPRTNQHFEVHPYSHSLIGSQCSSESTDIQQYIHPVFKRNRYTSNRISPDFDDRSATTNSSSKVTEAKMFHSHSSRLGITKDHHGYLEHKRKAKRKKICAAAILVISFLLLLPIIIIPSVILTQRKTKTVYPAEARLRWNSTGITVAGTLGLSGAANDRLNTPIHLAVDYLNTMYIADYSCHRIQRWFRNASSGTTVAGNTNCSSGTNLNSLNYPLHILLDSDNNMYITEYINSRILFWPNNASSGKMIAGTGISGNASNQLYTPFGMSRDMNDGTVYVADTSNNRIMRYLYNASSGTVVAGGNGNGNNISQLNFPTSVYFESSSNSLVIVNYNGNNILRWKIGDSGWTLVAGSINGTRGSTSTLLSSPIKTTFDPMGNMYVADLLNHRIQLFLSGEANGTTIAGVTAMSGNDATHLNTPYGVALDNQLNLYVADSGNQRIQKFLRY
ncbi:unnamed protein product [Adineta ricciae]|uniref:NHL repeat containing protein n=1 Tax=Adineta ricciae TaxID=249248 RepID=A0A815AI28_ADIRI|nr:unnamed protein product [Adineta ricciae]CAF1431532.1 unnamed protein product [Adineta ricciae]